MAQRQRRVLEQVDPRTVNYGSDLFDDDAAWSPATPVEVTEQFRSPIRDAWLQDAPGALDTAHHDTGRLVLTNHGVSPTIFGPIADDDLDRSVPMGYTTLSIVEKRAVVADGRLARLWTAEYEPEGMVPVWSLLIPDDDGSVVTVPGGVAMAGGTNLGRQLATAFTHSRLMGGRAALLVKVLNSRNWH
jgi:hypothetical protein